MMQMSSFVDVDGEYMEVIGINDEEEGSVILNMDNDEDEDEDDDDEDGEG